MNNTLQGLNSFGSNFFGFLTHTTDLLTEGLTSLAEKAGVLLTHVWVIFTKQQLILGLQELLTGLAMLFVGGFFYKQIKSVNKDKKMADTDKGFILIILVLALAWFLYHGFQSTVASLPRLINPEYYALQEAANLLKQIKP